MVVAGCRGGGRGKRHASGTWSLHEAEERQEVGGGGDDER